MKRRFKTIGTAMVVVFALSAVAAASAAAAEHWYEEGQAAPITAGTETAITTAIGGEPFTLGATIAGVAVKIKCAAVATTSGSKVLNPTGTGAPAGTFKGAIKFSSCTVEPTAQHCEVQGTSVADPVGTITTNALKATAIATNKVEFFPEAGATEPFVTLKLSNCVTAGLNTTYKVTGTAVGLSNNTAHELEFIEANSSLKLGGIAAKFKGKAKVTATATGKAIEVKP